MSNEEKIAEQLEAERVALKAETDNRAKIQGWVPKEEFRGDQAKWISADEFVKRADHMMPILKSVNKKLEGQVSTLNQKLSDTQGMVKKMVEIQGKYSDDLYSTKLSEIRTQKRKAAQEQDFETYDRLEKEEALIKKPDPIKVEVNPANENRVDSPSPEFEQWKDENKTWWEVDQDMTDAAWLVGEQLKIKKSPVAERGKEKEFFDEVTRKMKVMFPAKFTNPNRNRSDIDESGLRGGDNIDTTGKKGWNDLPQEAKQQCNKLIGEIKGYTKEKYIKEYFEGV